MAPRQYSWTLDHKDLGALNRQETGPFCACDVAECIERKSLNFGFRVDSRLAWDCAGVSQRLDSTDKAIGQSCCDRSKTAKEAYSRHHCHPTSGWGIGEISEGGKRSGFSAVLKTYPFTAVAVWCGIARVSNSFWSMACLEKKLPRVLVGTDPGWPVSMAHTVRQDLTAR
jgi:hypothetical protein